MRLGRAVLVGGLIVGVLDGLDAVIFFGLRGVAPERIFQAIAAGLLGRSAYQGGLTTTALGVWLHFFNATCIVLVYVAASRKLRVLLERPVICGMLYGVLVYFVMNEVVIPLSALNRSPYVLPVVVNGILIHMFGVGLPSAFAARKAS